MTTLDYATVYETQFRHRRLRGTLLGLAAVFVSAAPLVFVVVSGLS